MVFTSNGKSFSLNNKTLIVGILNITPDSFSDGGNYNSIENALIHTRKLLEDGADIIDIGGQSTRPGYEEISLEEELNRVIPVVKAISKEFDCLISVDTYKSEVAKQALENGAHIINDIWGLQNESENMAKVAKEYDAVVIAMHNQNTKDYPIDIITSIRTFFDKTFKIAANHNIEKNKIIIDPGIGFGKGYDENIEVLSRLNELKDIAPILIGVSRKGFIGKDLNLSPIERDDGTLALNIFSITNGAKIIRVHNVLSHKRALSIADKVIYMNSPNLK